MVQTPFRKRSLFNSRDFGTLTGYIQILETKRSQSFSPLTGILVLWHEQEVRDYKEGVLVSVPLRGFWYSDENEIVSNDFILSFSPLTGILVLRLQRLRQERYLHAKQFQSPYGDFGTPTLSPSTRSQTGLTGDFFKPPAFFAFLGDPGEK